MAAAASAAGGEVEFARQLGPCAARPALGAGLGQRQRPPRPRAPAGRAWRGPGARVGHRSSSTGGGQRSGGRWKGSSSQGEGPPALHRRRAAPPGVGIVLHEAVPGAAHQLSGSPLGCTRRQRRAVLGAGHGHVRACSVPRAGARSCSAARVSWALAGGLDSLAKKMKRRGQRLLARPVHQHAHGFGLLRGGRRCRAAARCAASSPLAPCTGEQADGLRIGPAGGGACHPSSWPAQRHRA